MAYHEYGIMESAQKNTKDLINMDLKNLNLLK